MNKKEILAEIQRLRNKLENPNMSYGNRWFIKDSISMLEDELEELESEY